MDPYLLIAKSLFTTAILGTLYEAYDNIWAEIAHEYGNDPAEIDAPRLKLAQIILELPRSSLADKALLEISAIAMMRMDNVTLR